ncbi:MAG TPA: hypothetical protein VFQ76_15280 [Longimicrobiaceae bacterium]|nr:hypothetical protein [Longimicrobiaceae bacterium]
MKDEKPFDAVQTMRQIREELSRELDGKTFEQQKRYIRERVRVPYGPDGQEPSGSGESAGS